MEEEWRDSYKPTWGPGGSLLYAIPGKVGNSSNKSTQADPILQNLKGTIVSEGRDIRFAKLTKTPSVGDFCSTVNTFMLIKCLAPSGNSCSATISHKVHP